MLTEHNFMLISILRAFLSLVTLIAGELHIRIVSVSWQYRCHYSNGLCYPDHAVVQ